MPQKVLLVGHLVSAPLAVHPASAGRSAFHLVTKGPAGLRQLLVIAGPAHRNVATTSRAGDLLYVEGDCVPHCPDLHPLVPTVRACNLVRLASLPAAEGLADFTAVIRWQSDQDPSWELETRHPGFASSDAAALYAAGLAPRSADHLLLTTTGALHLTLSDHTSVTLDSAYVQVWRREHRCARAGHDPAHDDGFRAVDLAASELVHALRRQPSFTRLHFHLLSPTSQFLDASIDDGADGCPLVRITDVARIVGRPPAGGALSAAAR